MNFLNNLMRSRANLVKLFHVVTNDNRYEHKTKQIRQDFLLFDYLLSQNSFTVSDFSYVKTIC